MKIPRLIICTDTNIGDSICAMAAVQYIVSLDRDQPTYLSMAHNEVTQLMSYGDPVLATWDARALKGTSVMHVVKLDVGQALLDLNRDRHLINSYLSQAGINIPFVPQPKIDVPWFHWDGKFYPPDVPQYDYLFAPWSQDPTRSMTPYAAGLLANALPGSVGILGGPHDLPIVASSHACLEHEYGRPLYEVVAMMRKARAVITVDSGMNRLAHAADISNHLILHPNYLPEHWVGHPKATIVREPWDTDRVLAALLEMETKHALERAL